VATAFARYQHLLIERGLVDHGDQVGLAVRLLAQRPAVRALVRQRYRYVVVDEAQDANPQQLELVRAVAGEAGNVVLVGDDDQAIYSFRGAVGHALGGLDERFRDLRHIVLRRNYRSRGPILEVARRLIRNNDPHRLEVTHGLDKTPTVVRRSRRPAGVRHHAFTTAGEEADWVATEVARRIRAGSSPGAIAILVRTNAEARPLLASLDAMGVPARFSGASGMLAQREVRDVLALLRAIAAPGGSEDLYAVLASAPYRLGGEDLAALCEMASRRRRSLWATCLEVVEQPGILRLSADGRARLERVVGDLQASLALAPDRDAPAVLYSHLRRSGWLASLVGAAGSGDERPLRCVARLFEAVRDQADLLADDRVASVVPALQALLDAGEDVVTDDDEEPADEVSVLTVHQAKGLEFRTVFVVGLADGRFPLRGRPARLSLPAALGGDGDSDAAGTGEAEERRLLYVAMTRARDELVLTHAVAGARGGRRRRPSPFLAEALGVEGCAPDPGGGAELALGPLSSLEPGDGQEAPLAQAVAGRQQMPLDLSFSQVDDYLTCPMRFRLRHQLRVPTAPNHALVFGNAMHQAVAVANRCARRGAEAAEEEVLAAYQAHWRSEGFLSQEHEDARYEAGRQALRRYRDRLAGDTAVRVLAVEEPFSVRIDGHRVSGRYDAVLETPGGVVITDFKSSDVRDVTRARQRARASLQLHLYALAWEAQHGRLPDGVALHFLEAGVVGEVSPRADRLDRARQQIGAAAAGIGAGRFDATPGYPACEWCPYRRVCPSAA
jgi:DNA helicase-2/ATP-dependent DNA helicase PcrA